jgi:hypothetical protein
VCRRLKESKLRENDTVLLLFPPGLDFVISMLACFHVGVIAVPAYPPNPRKLAADLPKLQHLVTSCQPAAVVCSSSISPLRRLAPFLHDRQWLVVDGWIKQGLSMDEGVSSGGLRPRCWPKRTGSRGKGGDAGDLALPNSEGGSNSPAADAGEFKGPWWCVSVPQGERDLGVGG